MSRLGQAMGTQRPRKRNFFYPTIDPRAIPPLLAHLPAGTRFAEPCAGAAPALWIACAALLPGLLFGLYAFAGLTMVPDRATFWTGGLAVGALVGLIATDGELLGAPIGAGAAAELGLYAEAVTAALRRLGYGDPLEG